MKKSRKPGYAVAIIVNAILLYVTNNLLAWRVPFLTPEFARALPAINTSLAATMVGNFFFLFYDASRFRHLAQMVLNVIAFVAAYTLFSIFPFSVQGAWLIALRTALIAALIGTGIAFLVEFVQFLRGKD